MKRILSVFAVLLSQSAFAQDIPQPSGLKAEYVVEGSKRYIMLSWDKDPKDTLTTGYNILMNFPPSKELLILGEAGVIYENIYKYSLQNSRAETYRLAVIGLQNFPQVRRSRMSEEVEVSVPSVGLPNIEIKEIKLENGTVTLVWDYEPFINDIGGYNIYMNNRLFETVEKPGQMVWSKKIQEKGSYIFEICAVSSNGVLSRKSQKRLVKIQ